MRRQQRLLQPLLPLATPFPFPRPDRFPACSRMPRAMARVPSHSSPGAPRGETACACAVSKWRWSCKCSGASVGLQRPAAIFALWGLFFAVLVLWRSAELDFDNPGVGYDACFGLCSVRSSRCCCRARAGRPWLGRRGGGGAAPPASDSRLHARVLHGKSGWCTQRHRRGNGKSTG